MKNGAMVMPDSTNMLTENNNSPDGLNCNLALLGNLNIQDTEKVIQDFKNSISKNIKLSFTGMVTFVKEPICEVLEKINLKDFFLETDSPYLAPTPYRGKRNEPSLIKFIAEYIADVKQISSKEVIKQTTKNALNFFKKMNPN